jgi:23S rRNA (guanosine2251-2'-O)-methyltransferase
MFRTVLVIHNVRSSHNVGSLLRSADGFGVEKVYITGFSPYPALRNDDRLPHIAEKTGRQINKTALGAEQSVSWERVENIKDAVAKLKNTGYEIAALEQSSKSQNLVGFKPRKIIALIVGNEVEGLDGQSLELADVHLEIPMRGKKESFNVAVAGGIAMFYFAALDM